MIVPNRFTYRIILLLHFLSIIDVSFAWNTKIANHSSSSNVHSYPSQSPSHSGTSRIPRPIRRNAQLIARRLGSTVNTIQTSPSFKLPQQIFSTPLPPPSPPLSQRNNEDRIEARISHVASLYKRLMISHRLMSASEKARVKRSFERRIARVAESLQHVEEDLERAFKPLNTNKLSSKDMQETPDEIRIQIDVLNQALTCFLANVTVEKDHLCSDLLKIQQCGKKVSDFLNTVFNGVPTHVRHHGRTSTVARLLVEVADEVIRRYKPKNLDSIAHLDFYRKEILPNYEALIERTGQLDHVRRFAKKAFSGVPRSSNNADNNTDNNGHHEGDITANKILENRSSSSSSESTSSSSSSSSSGSSESHEQPRINIVPSPAIPNSLQNSPKHNSPNLPLR